jgi:hypothetical protein
MASNCSLQPPFRPAGVPAESEVGPPEPELEGDAVVGGEVAVGADDAGNYAYDLVGAPGWVGVRGVVTAGDDPVNPASSLHDTSMDNKVFYSISEDKDVSHPPSGLLHPGPVAS